MERDVERSVKRCYSTWSDTYYDEYYGEKAPYPPVHRDLLKRLLKEAGIKNLLDAGCGPASFLRDMIGEGIDLYGFDLTPEMVSVGRRIFAERGLNPNNIWEGSVLSPEDFSMPGKKGLKRFDAAVCFGVMPHVPPEHDITVLKNLKNSVKKNGLVIVEARNMLFALFTMNRFSYQLIKDELIQAERLREKAGNLKARLDNILEDMKTMFRMDLPPVRKGKEDEPGYDEILSRTHNPLVLKDQFTHAGFKNVRVLFYHYHALPPMFGSQLTDFFNKESVAMENPEDWRGYFMASAFLITGNRA
jgi:SAM-dependent methyltransferase